MFEQCISSIQSYSDLLKGCIRLNSLDQGKHVHAHMVQNGVDLNIRLGNTLIEMYAKCGSMVHAHRVFDKMPSHNIFSWNAIISAYAKLESYKEVANIFQELVLTGIVPDSFVFVSVLQACSNLDALEPGRNIHAYVIKSCCDTDIYVGNSLINMYAKCGILEDARQMFDKMPERDMVSYNIMITGYAQQGLGDEVFILFSKMQNVGMKPCAATFISVLKACSSLVALEQFHADIVRSGFDLHVIIGNTLVDMYAKCGSLHDALNTFNKMHKRDIITWTAAITGYVQQGLGVEALALVNQMRNQGLEPNVFTFVSILKACSSLTDLEQGKQCHAEIVNCGLECNVFIGSSLVDMYAKCGCIQNALLSFNKICKRDLVLWNSMISSCAQQGLGEEVFSLFQRLRQQGVKPDQATFVSILKACASMAALEQAKQIHSQIIICGFELHMLVASALVDMYAKCGSIKDAHHVFEGMWERDVVTWTVMISGYVQQGCGDEAFRLFEEMQKAGAMPDEVTFVSALKACASPEGLERGKQVHAYMIECGFCSDMFVGNTLIDMYAKCGSIKGAQKIFNMVEYRDVVSWNALIAGYAQQGLGKGVLELFRKMKDEGVNPNEVTFISVLSACSHSGLVDEGYYFFDSMARDYGVPPTEDHYICMVDLISRAGNLDKAEEFVKKIPCQFSEVIWTALLGACRMCGNVELAKHACRQVLELNPQNTAAYVLLSNTYAATEARMTRGNDDNIDAWESHIDFSGLVH